ncbi:ATP-binding protein [Cryptosporangium sp. NPDC048952]|uniref:sensor histidine kinase n=1 Tax=Cryptosporangium sp. NPDC048952 TaxID=3363961 RepID=UPI0037116768
MIPRSLRGRLLLISAMLLIAGLVVSDAVVTTALRGYLVDRVDHQLQPIALVMARIEPSLVPVERAVGSDSLDLISALAVVYLDADGSVVRSASMGPAPPEVSPSLPRGRAISLDGDWRAVVEARSSGGVVVVAAPLTPINATIDQLRLWCLVTGMIVVALLTGVGWVAIRAGLRPLRTIEHSAAAIAGGDLTHRIPDAGPPGTEVARLTFVLNTMLTQIERAFAARAESEARMRRFVADVSHELRTPLFGIKGSAELHLMRGGSDETIQRIDREAGRLAALVEDLLLLARLDESAAGPLLELAPMDLRTLAVDARHDLRSLDAGRPVELSGVGGEGAPGAALVLGDEARLRQVVSNLVGNVHAHTPVDAPVRVGVGRVGDSAVLEVADTGPGLSAEEAGRVFERFHRGDHSRSGPGAGLGLAIVRSLVVAHGGQVEVVATPGGGATFRVVLPWNSDF